MTRVRCGWAALALLIAASTAAHADDQATLREQLTQRDQLIQRLQERIRQLEGDRQPAQAPPPAEPATNASGLFAVDALAAERALERTLTQSGALLLPPGEAELQLGASYARRHQQSATLVTQDGQLGLGSTELRRNDVTATLSARFGLPFDAQLEFTLPYRVIRQSLVEPVDFTASRETRSSSVTVGDVTLGVARTLLREQGWRPDLIGRVGWNAGNGKASSNNIDIGDGFRKIRAELTALKRQDPIVFTGNLSWESTFRNGALKPGDQLGLSLAALLATSPDTSMSMGIDQIFARKTRVNGVALAGSDQVSSMLTLGATTMIGKRTLLSVSTGIGLTRNTPDYVINVTVPLRFELFK